MPGPGLNDSPLLPAVLACIDAVPSLEPDDTEYRRNVAWAVLRAAVDAHAIVARSGYDALDTERRQALGRCDRLTRQLADVGDRRQRAETLCHALADALGSGAGADEALDAYRSAEW